MKVWLLKEGETLPCDENPRLGRMGLLANELFKLNCDITWWSSTFSHAKKTYRYLEDTNVEIEKNYRLNLIHSIQYRKNVSISRLWHEFDTAKKFYQIAEKQEKPNIIVTAMPSIAFTYYATKYAKKNNVPVIVDVRDLNPDAFVAPFSGIIKKIVGIGIIPLKKMLSISLKRANGIVATTDPYLEWALNYAKREKIETDRVFFVSYPDAGVKNALSDESRWKKYEHYDGITCCFFGMFANMADIETVLKTAEKCKNKNLNVRFILCGTGENLELYESYKKEKKLENVDFPGWVNKDDIQDVGFVSDVGLMAYKQDKNFEWQMPNKFSEYLSLGLLIMLQPTGVMLEYIEKYKCGMHYSNSDELYSNLLSLLENSGELEEIKRKSRILFEEQFCVEKVYSEYAKYIIKMGEKYEI